MAKYTDSKCKLCRREGMRLFLKGERCNTEKCAISRKKGIPGADPRGRRFGKLSEYGRQLREKQKIKRIYGVLEKQFKRFFGIAARKDGKTGENLMSILERRLDNVVFRLNFAQSRSQARQFVNHGHFTVNGKKVDIPSFLVNEGDEISLRESSKIKKDLSYFMGDSGGVIPQVPEWLEITSEGGNYKGRIKELPTRRKIDLDVNEQLVVELYSK